MSGPIGRSIEEVANEREWELLGTRSCVNDKKGVRTLLLVLSRGESTRLCFFWGVVELTEKIRRVGDNKQGYSWTS